MNDHDGEKHIKRWIIFKIIHFLISKNFVMLKHDLNVHHCTALYFSRIFCTFLFFQNLHSFRKNKFRKFTFCFVVWKLLVDVLKFSHSDILFATICVSFPTKFRDDDWSSCIRSVHTLPVITSFIFLCFFFSNFCGW